MRKPVLCLLLTCFLKGVSSVNPFYCSLGKFQCLKDGQQACIDKTEQCDGRNDCDDKSDEYQCKTIGYCSLDKLQCTDRQDATNTLCLDPATSVCLGSTLQAEPLCKDAQDKENCRCNEYQRASKPVRCPTDGKCYASANKDTFCASCPGALNCNQNMSVDDCGKQPGYFSCVVDYARNNKSRCYPDAALCDSYKNCEDDTDSPGVCIGASVTLLTDTQPTGLYLRGDYTIKYSITGHPLPKYKFYQFHKELTLPIIKKPFNTLSGEEVMDEDENSTDSEDENSTVFTILVAEYIIPSWSITSKLIVDNEKDNTYILEVVFTNLTQYQHGDYDLVVYNVRDTDDPDTNTGFYQRSKADTVYLHLSGAPEVKIMGEMSNGIGTLLAVDNEQFILFCLVEMRPFADTDKIEFYQDDSIIDDFHKENSKYNYTLDESKQASDIYTAKVSFLPQYDKDHNSVFKCSAKNGVGEDYSGDVILDVMVPARVLSVTFSNNAVEDMGKTKMYTRRNDDVKMTCNVIGTPSPQVSWTLPDGSTQNTAELNVKADVEKVYTCKTSNSKGITNRNDKREVTLVPLAKPTIAVEVADAYIEKSSVNVVIEVTSPHVDHYPDIKVTETATGKPPSNITWNYNCDTDASSITKCVMKTDSIAYESRGSYEVVADTIIPGYGSTDSFDIKVLVPIRFVKELEKTVKVLVNDSYTFEVEVFGDPAPSSYIWYFKDTVIPGETGKNYIASKMQLTDSGIYKVSVKQTIQGKEQVLSSSIDVTVSDNPCLGDPCKNGAECKHLGGTTFKCTCNTGFKGDLCEENMWCDTTLNKCQNGGQCSVKDSPLNYECACDFGYEDRNCSTKIDYCERGGNARCGGGLCQNNLANSPDGFDCYCKQGEGGLYCDLDQLCTPNPCLNKGTCSVVGYAATRKQECTCAAGFEGTTCEKPADGWCEGKCNNRALCYSHHGTCMCSYPYWGTACLKELTNEAQLYVPATGHLVSRVTEDRLLLDDRVTQHFVLPVSLLLDVGQLLCLHNDDKSDMVTLTLKDSYLNIAVNCGGIATNRTLAQETPLDTAITITVVLQYTKLTITVEDYMSGSVIAEGMDLQVVCSPLTTQVIGDPKQFDTADDGIELSIWSHFMVGGNSIETYQSGRSVEPTDNCPVELCRNGGTCNYGNGKCECPDGYTGEFCETLIDPCTFVECLNNGYCHLGFCECTFGFYGTMCERRLTDTTVLLLHDQSSVHYDVDDTLTSLEFKMFAQFNVDDFNKAVGLYLLTVGGDFNNINLHVGYDKMLYLIVTRGPKKGVYDGLGSAAALCGCDPATATTSCYTSLHMTIDQDALITITITKHTDGSDDKIKVINVGKNELASPDGLPALQTVHISGVPVPVLVYDVKINGAAVSSPTSGTNVLTLVDFDPCGQCGGTGTCTKKGNMAKCTDCPDHTDPNTCMTPKYNPGVCRGTCSATSGCVCDYHQQGEFCDKDLVTVENAILKTKSPYHSWMKYQSVHVEGPSFDLRFSVKVDGNREQHGQLMYIAGDVQSVSIYLDKEVMTIHSFCSPAYQHKATLPGLTPDTWHAVQFKWSMKSLTISIDEDITHSLTADVDPCNWELDGSMFLGGMPDGAPGSVVAAFAAVKFADKELNLPVGGSNLELTDDNLCDVAPGPCDVSGKATCVADGRDYTCTCKPGYAGRKCERPKVPCEDVMCTDNQKCVEGTCLCVYPYDQAVASCATNITSLIGVKCVKQGTFTPVFNSSFSRNDFDLMFRIKMENGIESGLYNILTLGMYSEENNTFLEINVDVSKSSQDGTTTFSYTMKIAMLNVVYKMSSTWTPVRIFIGNGLIDVSMGDMTKSQANPIQGVSYPNSIQFGNSKSSYGGCLSHIMLNGTPISYISSGTGVISCEDEVISDGSQDNFGSAELWAKAGIL